MKPSTAILVLTIAGSAAGCAQTPLVDPAWCGPGAESGKPQTVEVTVDVTDAGTMIAVDPKECRVRPGTRITWIAAGSHPETFEAIEFQQGTTPDALDRTRIDATSVSRQRQAESYARWAQAEETHKYSVLANGEELDPVVIIDPR